jgi:hypothetical protein
MGRKKPAPYDYTHDDEVAPLVDAQRLAEKQARAAERESARLRAELEATRAALKTCALVLKPYSERS